MRRGVHSLEASCTHHLFYRSRAHPRLPLLASSSWLFLSLLVSCVRHCVAFTSSSVIVVLLHRMHCLGSGLIGANNRLLHPSHERRRPRPVLQLSTYPYPWHGGQPPLVSHDRGLAAVAEDAASSASSAVYSLLVGTPDWRMPIQGWGRAPLTRSIVLLAMPATLQPAGRVSSPRVSPRLMTRKITLDRSFHK